MKSIARVVRSIGLRIKALVKTISHKPTLPLVRKALVIGSLLGLVGASILTPLGCDPIGETVDYVNYGGQYYKVVSIDFGALIGAALAGSLFGTPPIQLPPPEPANPIPFMPAPPPPPPFMHFGTQPNLEFTPTHQKGTRQLTGANGPAPGDQTILIAGGALLDPTAEVFFPGSPSYFAPPPGRMKSIRGNHTATYLTTGPDAGKVLIAGGEDNASIQLASAELYDPTTGTFGCVGGTQSNGSCANSMAPRQLHTATLLSDGTVLLAGGVDTTTNSEQGGVTLASAQIYNPATRQFSNTAGSLNNARTQQSAAILGNGQVLLAGGRDSKGFALSTAELYDPVQQTFTLTAGNMTQARPVTTATYLDPKYVSGALAAQVLVVGSAFTQNGIVNSADLFNPSTGQFTAVSAPTNEERFDQGAVLLPNGKVLIFGGSTGNTNSGFADAELFDPSNQSFTPTNQSPCPNAYTGNPPPAGCLFDGVNFGIGVLLTSGPQTGLVLIAGGFTNVTAAELFDPSSNTFKLTDYAPVINRQGGRSATALQNGQVLFTGGQALASVENQSEVFDATTNTTYLVPAMLTERVGGTATALGNGRALLAGGMIARPGVFVLEATQAAELYDYSKNLYRCADGSYPQQASSPEPPFALTCSNGPAMTGHRLLQTATTVTSGPNSGKVLLAGGDVGVNGGSTPQFLPTAELYDPKAGAFSCIGGTITNKQYNLPQCADTMTDVRFAHTATLMTAGLQVGKILISGGVNLNITNTIAIASLATAELYDTATETFSCVGGVSKNPPTCNNSMTDSRYGHTASPLAIGPDEGKILLTGGTGTSGAALATAELYDPGIGKFLCVGGVSKAPPVCNASMTAGRTGHTATTLPDGRILIIGGSSGDKTNGFTNLASAEIYDPNTGKFSSTGSMAFGRAFHSAMLLSNGNVMVAGGVTGSFAGSSAFGTFELQVNDGITGDNLTSIEEYNPSQATFTKTGFTAMGRSGFMMAPVQQGGASPTPTATGSVGATPTATPAATPSPTLTPSPTPTATSTPVTAKVTLTGINFGKSTFVNAMSNAKHATLKNASPKKGGPTVVLGSVTTDNPRFKVVKQCSPSTLPPGKSCQIFVSFSPIDTTAQTGHLIVNDNAVGSPQMSALSGTGKMKKGK
jgi:hypothetical protein